jgi:cobalt-zinc-cadmium efflux system outer membrane protein
MYVQRVRLAVLLLVVSFSGGIFAPKSSAQAPPAQPPVPPAPKIQAPAAQVHGAVRLTLDEAIQLALEHNHNLKAAETTIQQNQALEITANLRPNPVLTADAQFLPIFQPNEFNADYVDNVMQFDIGVSYLFERGNSTACKPPRTPRHRRNRPLPITSALSLSAWRNNS